jgi:apolipoprotein N-acyltransferase
MRSLFGSLHTPSSFSPLSGRPPGRSAGRSSGVWWLLCMVAGALQAASLAWPLANASPTGTLPGQPDGVLQVASLALLVLGLQHSDRTGQAVWRGWLFATVWLVGTFWWLFISMHTYGGLAAWMAVLAVLALAGALALPYAVAAGLLRMGAPASRTAQALLFAALWTLAELVRGHWFTGFPWGAAGYAQVDLMAAWAPWVGVYGMGFLAALLAYALASMLSGIGRVVSGWVLSPASRAVPARGGPGGRAPKAVDAGGVLLGLLGLVGLAALLWSLSVGAEGWRKLALRATDSAGSLNVWLLQGNIAQDEKFEPGTGVVQALEWYPAQMADAMAAATRGGTGAPQLVVAPETAVPLLPQQLNVDFWRPVLEGLSLQKENSGVAAMLGLPLGSFSQGYTNSAWGISPRSAAQALQGLQENRLPAAWEATGGADEGFFRYDKHHLVPFGEFIPPLFRWFINLMNIPLGDFNRGPLGQPSWAWGGQQIAPNICYEDLFGEELAASFRSAERAPTVLVNLSNIGWFGDSVAIDQHLHISRLRAMELGRPMLRATNTGATAVIDHLGQVTHQLPRLTRDRLEASVQGRTGLTPFARWASRWGQWPLWGACVVLAGVVMLGRRRGGRGRAAP